MKLFRGRKARTAAGAVVSDRSSSKADLQALQQFASSRRGVEAFIEPQTTVTSTTLLLVAGDGESMRRRVASPDAARDFARKKLNIPIYDASIVGIPQRKREYDLKQSGRSSSRPTTGARKPTAPTEPAPAKQTPKELAAIMTLETIAGVDPLPTNPTREQLEKVWRQARANTHPDRTGGDRTRWDKVEDAARSLGLH